MWASVKLQCQHAKIKQKATLLQLADVISSCTISIACHLVGCPHHQLVMLKHAHRVSCVKRMHAERFMCSRQQRAVNACCSAAYHGKLHDPLHFDLPGVAAVDERQVHRPNSGGGFVCMHACSAIRVQWRGQCAHDIIGAHTTRTRHRRGASSERSAPAAAGPDFAMRTVMADGYVELVPVGFEAGAPCVATTRNAIQAKINTGECLVILLCFSCVADSVRPRASPVIRVSCCCIYRACTSCALCGCHDAPHDASPTLHLHTVLTLYLPGGGLLVSLREGAHILPH